MGIEEEIQLIPAMRKMFKIVSYNIHRGLSPFRKVPTLKRISHVMNRSDADMLCFQEVWARPEEIEPPIEEFASDRWKHRAYGKNAIFSRGHQGNAIIARYAIEKHSNLDLSFPGREGRGALLAKIKVPGLQVPLNLICIHLGLVFRERKSQIESLKTFLDKEINQDEPLIIAGDFNDWNQKSGRITMEMFDVNEAFKETNGTYCRTFPSNLPIFPLDRIYYRNLNLEATKVHKGRDIKHLSDHLPIEASFSLYL